MNNHEQVVLGLNLALVVLAYAVMLPRVAGGDLVRLAWFDLFSSALAVTLAGLMYHGSGLPFSLAGLSVNWFWYALVTYFLIETPFAVWYLRRHGVKLS